MCLGSRCGCFFPDGYLPRSFISTQRKIGHVRGTEEAADHESELVRDQEQCCCFFRITRREVCLQASKEAAALSYRRSCKASGDLVESIGHSVLGEADDEAAHTHLRANIKKLGD